MQLRESIGFINIIRDWLGGVDNGPRKTMAGLLRELRLQNRRERIRDRQRRQIRRHLKKINKKQTRTTSKDLHKTVDQTTERNVLICLLDISQSTTDLGMTLTTDKQKTGKELVPYRPPASLLNLRIDVTAACELARVFQTMLAAVHASQITRRGHVTDYSPTGLEVVVYRPRPFFHRLTLDLTVACDIARMFQSPSAALIYVDTSKFRVFNIHAELLDGNDGFQTQIVADETVSVDSEKQSCDDIFSLGESCDQQQTDVTIGLGTSTERDVEKEGSHAFLFDEDIAKLPYVEPMRPQQLVKWEELSDVTDHGLDLDQDQTTVRNVLICLFDISQSTTDPGMTLTTDKQKTGKELVPYRPPASSLNLQIDVTVACDLARVFQTMLSAVHASQITRRGHVTDYSPTGLEVVVYRPRHVFHRLTLDLSAACDLARVFQTMLAAVHASQITRRGHVADYSPTGLEVVVYRPRPFFHRLTLDLTVACDIARMFQSPSAALIYVDNSKLRVPNIHAELLDGNDGVQTQIVADETVSVDSEKQSCDDIFSLGESCNQQQTDVTTGLVTSNERDVEKEGSHAFLFDEDIAKLPYVEPMRPQQLVKWEELSDVTDHGLDLDQDQTTVRNVLICLLDISQSTTDLGMTLTTDKQKTGKELVPYRPPASLLNLRIDVTAACDLARVFQTMLAAVHASQITRRGHVTDYSPTGLEVVVYRPRPFFHRLTLDLTVACDIARMFQSPSAALIYVDNSKFRVFNIHAELLDGNDGAQTQIVADETVIVDSEKQSCDDIFSLGESCDQQQTDVTIGLGTSNERDVEKEGSHAFLFDEDIAKLPCVEPMRPQQLVKWEELSDVTDHGLDLDQDQTTVRNVLICLFDISQTTTDLGMTLTTDKQKTGKELVPYRPPASLLNLRIDVTAACELARVFQTMLAAVHASQTTRRGDMTDYSPTGLEVVVYRPHHVFHRLTLDLTAACDLARVIQTMLAAVHASQITRRGHMAAYSPTGLEVVVYRPRPFFHRLTLDLTVACDIARMFQSPSDALIYVDYSKFRVLNIHAELLDGNDGVQPQIVADETVSVDSEKQSCDDIFSLGESCDQQQTDVTTVLGTSNERDVEKGSHAFLFDEDIAKLPYVEPMRPQQLVKWEELSDVTDHGLDLDQDQTTVRNVLICLLDISQTTTDLGMTLTTDKQKTGKELVPYRPPASLLNLRIDVTAACDLARVFQTMLAAVHASQITRRRHVTDYSPTGLEVVVYRPRPFFHRWTLDLTVACDIARMFQSPSAALIYVDNSKFRVFNIHAELLDGNDGAQTQIVADETVSVDSEKQSCDDIFSLGESCDQQQTDVTIGLGTSNERDVEKEGSHAFLFDEDIAKLPCVEPMRPQQLVKWEELSDVTDHGLDLDQDQTTVRNVLICLLDISQTTTDLGMTLTTDKQKTGKELVPYRPPASLLNLRIDVTAACELARVFQTMLAAVHASQTTRRGDMADYSPTGLEVVVYRPHHVFHRLTLDLTAGCDLARVIQTMLAAVHASQITRRGHMAAYSPTGLEVVVYRPRPFFHRLTLDLTVACDIARMFQSPSAALIYVDYSKFRVLNIHAELLDGNDGVQPQIVADETVSVDSEKQSCDDIFSLGESCDQQQTDVTTGLGTSNERDVEKGSHAFLFDEDIAKLPYVEPMRPQQLVKWEELSDVTDHGLDLDQQGEGWDVNDMFATNEADFGFKSTFDETLSEYTTLLVKEATPDYQLRWERACRLADEIEGKKKAEQANRAKQPKKRKKKNRRSKKSGCPY
ncbi:uncharacterized protein [Apostichopus japonicus]|uniref:uncharacterized protein isoform X3 n=1 Tax=Stichopus japonicus TaxID=307972 RepID=UPI003AB3686A